jgi:hypothetical protein
VGDENLSFEEFFGHFAAPPGAGYAGRERNPLPPDSTFYFGRGNTLYYEPDAPRRRCSGTGAGMLPGTARDRRAIRPGRRQSMSDARVALLLDERDRAGRRAYAQGAIVVTRPVGVDLHRRRVVEAPDSGSRAAPTSSRRSM